MHRYFKALFTQTIYFNGCILSLIKTGAIFKQIQIYVIVVENKCLTDTLLCNTAYRNSVKDRMVMMKAVAEMQLL